MIEIREIQNGKGEVCNIVLRSLPKWFSIESAIVDYVKDVETMPTLVADIDGQKNSAFLSLNFHNEFNAEIHVMGVLPHFHGKGLGKALVKEAERLARSSGRKFLSVKTLSASRPNAEYDLTRKFYLSAGFLPLEEFKTLWGEANPCLLMIKTV